MPSFDLIDEPWIPILQPDGTKRLGGIRSVLLGAGQIREIADPSPLVTVALHRLLLAILHRCFGPADEGVWADLWQAGAFDAATLDGYLNHWRHRFDLFHATHPFYQTVDLDPVYAGPVTKLPLSAGKREPLFEHYVEDASYSLTVPEAARELVALHAFAIAGLLSYERHLDPRIYKSAKGGPLAKSAVVLMKGDTLFHTLMLNLLRYDPANDAPFPVQGDDRPAWERDEPTQAMDRLPTGYLDLLTWQSRRARLLPEPAGDGSTWIVRRAIVMKGHQFPEDWPVQSSEPMVAFYRRTNAKPNEPAWQPVGFQRGRALWRDSLALIQAFSQDERVMPPKAIPWLSDLVVTGVLDRSAIYRMDVAGLNTDQALVNFWRYERLPLPLAYLADKRLIDELSDALALAEEVGDILRQVTETLATLLISPSASDGSQGRQPDRSQVDSVVQHLATDRTYWARLETPFKRLLIELPTEMAITKAGGTAPGALVNWAQEVKRSALEAFEEATEAAGSSARALRAVALAERGLPLRIDKAIEKRVTSTAEGGS
jgi:CRISPR system Cascade subunit CasA